MGRTYLVIFKKSLRLRYNRLDTYYSFTIEILSMCYDKDHHASDIRYLFRPDIKIIRQNCLFSMEGEIDSFTGHQFFKKMLLSLNVFEYVLRPNTKMEQNEAYPSFIWPTTTMARKLF